MLTPIVMMIFIIFLSAVFNATEVALVVISDNKVNLDADRGNKKALLIQKFTEKPKS